MDPLLTIRVDPALLAAEKQGGEFNRLPAAAQLPLGNGVSKPKLQQNRLPTRSTTSLDMNPVPCQPGELMEMRVGLLRDLVQSLEVSQFALARNDAEVIARGAAHQAELCRQWGLVEDQLHRAAESRPARSRKLPPIHPPICRPIPTNASPVVHLEKEFAALGARIGHLTRVHCSLLRHLNRSLAIVAHVVDSCSPTYTPELTQRPETRPQAGD